MSETETPIFVNAEEIKKKAEQIKEARALPPKPGDRVKFSELQAWLKLLPEDAKERVTVWIYRQEPIINLQLVDPQSLNNIEVVYSDFEKLTEEYIIHNHGGGTYKFVIKDEDKPKTQKGGFFEARLGIAMMEHAPKLDLRTVVWDNPKNRGFMSWARAKGMIDDNNMPVTMTKTTDDKSKPDSDSMVQAMKLAMDFATKMSEKDQVELKRKLGGEDAVAKSMQEIMLEKMKQDDPNKFISTISTLMVAMKNMTPVAPPVQDSLTPMMTMFTTMMTSYQEQSKQTMALFMEMIKSNHSKSEGGDSGGSSKISEFKEMIELARELAPGGGGKRSTAEVIVDAVGPILGPAMNLAATFLQQRGSNGAVPQPVSKPVVDTNIVSQEPQMSKQIPQNELVATIQQFGPLLINNFAREGWMCAEEIGRLFPQGELIVASIIKHGTDEIITVMKQVPEFWKQADGTFGEPHVRKWVDEFVRYKEIIKEMEAGEEEEGAN